jgi:hypothetical protein
MYVASPPSLRMRSASSRSVSSSRAVITTLAPARAAMRAVVSPIPLDAPVITIT